MNFIPSKKRSRALVLGIPLATFITILPTEASSKKSSPSPPATNMKTLQQTPYRSYLTANNGNLPPAGVEDPTWEPHTERKLTSNRADEITESILRVLGKNRDNPPESRENLSEIEKEINKVFHRELNHYSGDTIAERKERTRIAEQKGKFMIEYKEMVQNNPLELQDSSMLRKKVGEILSNSDNVVDQWEKTGKVEDPAEEKSWGDPIQLRQRGGSMGKNRESRRPHSGSTCRKRTHIEPSR
ncbi:hypothetical protein [Pasteuria penetrans]|uniref:hypothetical protein n=1 Tax=Pasteuria penetrans TaxID=86005 RepID=UPI000FA8801B|nr:hypothetical protein [Pasteuria penetrans]